MNKEDRIKLLKEGAKSPFARALEELLDEEMAKINTVDGIETLDEAIGRQKAKRVLEVIFSFMGRANPQSPLKKENYT